MPYHFTPRFTPKKPIKSFRDLEVYQKTLECSVLISKDIAPQADKCNYAHTKQMVECALSVPLWVAEAHSLRFADFALALGYLEKAMSGCNKAVVYLDQLRGMYGEKVSGDVCADLAQRYVIVRIRMFRLEKAWRAYMDKTNEQQHGSRTA